MRNIFGTCLSPGPVRNLLSTISSEYLYFSQRGGIVLEKRPQMQQGQGRGPQSTRALQQGHKDSTKKERMIPTRPRSFLVVHINIEVVNSVLDY